MIRTGDHEFGNANFFNFFNVIHEFTSSRREVKPSFVHCTQNVPALAKSASLVTSSTLVPERAAT